MKPERCERCGADLSAFVDGEMRPHEKMRAASHILLCPHCAAEAGHLLAAKSLVSMPTRQAAVPEDLWSKISRRLEEADAARAALEQPAPRRSLVPSLAAAGLVCIAFALILRLALLRPQSSDAATLSALHERALIALGAPPVPEHWHAVAASTRPPLRMAFQAIDRAGSRYLLHRLYLLGRLPISVLMAPPGTFDTSGMVRRRVDGYVAHLGAAGDTAIAIISLPHMDVAAVSHTAPEDLLHIVRLLLPRL